MHTEKTTCCKTKPVAALKRTPSKRNGFLSFLSTALIIVLPKCPFCIAAYSGALFMFYEVDAAALAPVYVHLKPLLGMLVTATIAMNYKGRKSRIALAIVLVSMLFLLPAWVIYSAFFAGAWYNGNFEYFYRFLKKASPGEGKVRNV